MSEVTKSEILALIDREARMLGVTRDEALERVRSGNAGQGFVWSDISSLALLAGEVRDDD